MEFKNIGQLAEIYTNIDKEYLIYEDGDISDVTEDDETSPLECLKNELYDEFDGDTFGIETAVLLFKVGIKVGRKDNKTFNFTSLSNSDIIANDYYIV